MMRTWHGGRPILHMYVHVQSIFHSKQSCLVLHMSMHDVKTLVDRKVKELRFA